MKGHFAKRSHIVIYLIGLSSLMLNAQQIPDTTYNPQIHQPIYEMGRGSVIYIDEGHHNFHTKDGRYASFARLLARDGYQVKRCEGAFTKNQLSKGKILVISNAQHLSNVRAWYKPVLSAFTESEINDVKQWVRDGGRLFLIADHMPLAGAAIELAAVFGFEMTDGFVMRRNGERGAAIFSKSNGNLVKSIITEGRSQKESVEQVLSFTGQAFRIPEDAHPILKLEDNFHNLLPDTAWVFNNTTQVEDVAGWSQGAFKEYGKGRIVVFGEAAMFSGQLAGPQQYKMGMNNPEAKENYQLLLNIIHWLDGVLE